MFPENINLTKYMLQVYANAESIQYRFTYKV